jgi:hypothetical protein
VVRGLPALTLVFILTSNSPTYAEAREEYRENEQYTDRVTVAGKYIVKH